MNISALASITPAATGSIADPSRGPAATTAADRKKVSQQFEAILVRQLLRKTMTSMLGSGEDSTAGSVYGDMVTDSLAQQLTAGQGLGLGRMIEKQLTPRGTPVDAAAAKPSQP
jgi:peptidoglycan hydrolase FlgJ